LTLILNGSDGSFLSPVLGGGESFRSFEFSGVFAVADFSDGVGIEGETLVETSEFGSSEITELVHGDLELVRRVSVVSIDVVQIVLERGITSVELIMAVALLV